MLLLNASLTPSGNFNLRMEENTSCRCQQQITGTAVEVANLSNYSRNPFFYTGSDGAMVFRAAVDGATTSGSSDARSELREMNGTARAAWNLSTGGVMTCYAGGRCGPHPLRRHHGKVVVGQIHGQNDECRGCTGTPARCTLPTTSPDRTMRSTSSTSPTPPVSSRTFAERKISYVIDAKGSSLEVSVYADGDVYRSATPINSVWQSDTFNFKAGTYLGANETRGPATARLRSTTCGSTTPIRRSCPGQLRPANPTPAPAPAPIGPGS